MAKKIAILGAGESGIGAAILAQKKGFDVFVSDCGTIQANYIQQLEKYNINFEQGKHSEEKILSCDEVIKSPGIRNNAPLILKLVEKGIPVISEIEFAARYTNAVKVCITGSNGKTTTTELIYKTFKDAGLNVAIAGNVGKSFALQVAEREYDYYVIELSSF
ncbi:MAG: UDP-N-acetylmuramoyl-L-alanine--D-glutamate ligase, partial [Bacteroidales bacterium]|nr:UDP-N-acetylmuramoyl-L-alanine--D-glutamate ligase [Bacteroidales bacterium]